MFKNRENIYVGLLSLLIITMVSSYYSTISIILLVVFFLSDKKKNIKYKINKGFRNPIVIGLASYFFIHLAAYLYYQDSFSLKEMTQRLAYFFLPFVIISESVSYYNLKKIFRIFNITLMVVLFLLVGYHFIYFNKNIASFVYFGFKTLDISPFYYSVFIFVAMKINLELKSKYWYLELLLWFGFLFLLGNRTSILFILTYMGYYFFKEVNLTLLKKGGLSVLLLISLGVILLGSDSFRKKTNILFKTMSFDIETIQTKNSVTFSRNTLEHRILIWYKAMEIVNENLWFGVGVANYKTELYQKYDDINFKAAKKNKFNTHSQYIEELLKFGVFGVTAFIFMVLCFMRFTFYKDMAFPVLFLIVILSFFESFWYRHHGVLIISFLFPLLYVFNKKKTDYFLHNS